MNLLDKELHRSKVKEEDKMTVSRKRKALDWGEKVTPKSKKATETPKSCFASVTPENIMLVYLRRSSVEELLMDPETFHDNILGSYVRIQSDQIASQKNSHQLLQVAGVKKAPGCGEECILQVLVLPLIKDIPISMLSNEHFKEEECKDLFDRIIAGSAYRPTVMELQCKAQKLHKVITKQWLARELSLIQNLIDRDNKKGWCATEKGWRKELFEYLERKLLLQKPTEQEGILFTVPDVIPEDLEPESTVQKSAKHEKSNICSPKLTIVGTSAENLEPESTVQKSVEDEKRNICCSPKITIVGTSAGIDEGNTTSVKEANGRTSAGIDEEGNTTSVEEAIGVPSVVTLVEKLDINIGERTDIEPNITGSIVEGNHNSIEMKGSSEIAKNSKELELIDISEDTDDRQGVDDPDSALWFYEDPEQVIQGPFTARQLKTWKERNYFEQGFKVWKSGQTPVLLDDLISQMFPN